MAKQAQSVDEIIERLYKLTNGDIEASHIEADSLLLDALALAGYAEVITAYISVRDRVGFWYV